MRRANENLTELAEDLTSLDRLDRTALHTRWRKLYGTEPPVRLSQALLRQALAYRLQERALGGLTPLTCRRLARAVPEIAAGQKARIASSPKLRPGTRLLREWQGVGHEVVALENGVQFRGERYRSLSEVARFITGNRWSGPLFFGLKGVARR